MCYRSTDTNESVVDGEFQNSFEDDNRGQFCKDDRAQKPRRQPKEEDDQTKMTKRKNKEDKQMKMTKMTNKQR